MIIKKLKTIIKNKPALYTAFKGVQMCKNKDYQDLIESYYCSKKKIDVLKIESCGEKNKEKIFYIIDEGDKEHSNRGFWALVRAAINYLYFADEFSLEPYVLWGKHTLYFEKELINKKSNVFEYYFEPTTNISYKEILRSKHVMYKKGSDSQKVAQICGNDLTYKVNSSEIEIMAYIYKKYFHLNQETRAYIESNKDQILGKKKTLGIHVRGTDYKVQWKNHPHFEGFQVFIDECDRGLKEQRFEQIFLATDDEEALQLFKNKYGSKLIYYSDIQRSTGNSGPHSIDSDRELHHYKLGLEVLRDVYTLAECDGLITGLSQVSFAARYINLGLGKKFLWESTVEMEINQNGKDAGKTINK